MSAYVRSSTIPGPKETLVGGVGATGGDGAGTAREGGTRFGMTGKVWVGDGEAGPGVEVEGAGPEGRDAESSVSRVSGDEGVFEGGAGLTVEAGWGVSFLRTT